jgi:hypothetical protein
LLYFLLQSDDQYSAVMNALNKVTEANKKEIVEVERYIHTHRHRHRHIKGKAQGDG